MGNMCINFDDDTLTWSVTIKILQVSVFQKNDKLTERQTRNKPATSLFSRYDLINQFENCGLFIHCLNMLINNYYTLRSSLQIQRSAMLDDGTSHAGDLKSGSILPRGSIISKRPHVFECIHVTFELKHNTHMIRLYRTSTVSKDLNNANWVTLIVKLYSVTMNNRKTECE